MGFYLTDRIHSHTNNDKKCRPAEIEWDIKALHQDRRQHADRGDVQGTSQSNAGQDALDIIGCWSSRSQPRDIAAIFLHIVGNINRIKGNRGIKVAEEDNEENVKNLV